MPNLTTIAQYYFVDDLPGASIPSSRLRNILESMQSGRSISSQSLGWLQAQGLNALYQLSQNRQPYEKFASDAKSERSDRRLIATARREAEGAARRATILEEEKRQAAYWAQRDAERLARKSDPKHIAKMKNRELRARYGIDLFIEPHDFPRVMAMLRKLDCGNRLSDDDSVWLATSGREYFSAELRRAFHQREAEYFLAEYKQTGDPWNAVNASSHYRKCDAPGKANDLLDSIPVQRLKVAKIQAAVATTHGGVKRDLRCFDEALLLGTKAHAITPENFRPCTLLGAVNFERGNYAEGRDWYAKAVERGATERNVEDDLRGVLLRANKLQRQEIKAFLIADDPIRFKWVLGER